MAAQISYTSQEYRELKSKLEKGELSPEEQRRLKEILDSVEKGIRNQRGLASSSW